MKKAFTKSMATSLALLLALSLIIPLTAIAAQRTTNVLNDGAPQVDASGKAVWTAQDGTSDADTEVYFWNGTSVVQLTSNTINESSPQIDGGVTTWLATDTTANGGDTEVYYNGTGVATGTTQLTTDGAATANDDDPPSITTNSAGAKIVAWSRNDGTDYEVFTSTNGGAATALTADATSTGTSNDDTSVQAAGNFIIWLKSDGTRNDVYLSTSLGTPAQLTANNASSLDETSPVVDSTGKAAWLSGFGSTTTGFLDAPEIQYYNGTTVVALTSNGITESSLSISNGKVVWAASDGYDPEIFFNSTGVASATKRLTNNGMFDLSPVINGSFVVWYGARRGANASVAADENNEDNDVFLYDVRDGSTYQVNNDDNDQMSPDINSNNVAWTGFDGSDYEIFTDVVRSTSLSLKASAKKVKKGKAVTLSGTLKDSAGTAIKSRKVQIRVGSTVVKTAVTNSQGKFSAKVKPGRTTTYKAYFLGAGTNLKKTSKGKKVTVTR